MKKKKKSLWIRNTNGKPDAVLTMVFVGFVIVMFKVLCSGSITILGNAYSSSGIDPETILAVLTPTFGAYVGRRWTDSKYVQSQSSQDPTYDDITEGVGD